MNEPFAELYEVRRIAPYDMTPYLSRPLGSNLPHGENVHLAHYPRKNDAKGYVDVYATALPAVFFRVVMNGNNWEISTGTDAAQLVHNLALGLSCGLLVIKPRKVHKAEGK